MVALTKVLKGYGVNPAMVNRDLHFPRSSCLSTLSVPSHAIMLTTSLARQCCSTLIRSLWSLGRVTSMDSNMAV
ncbi:hypothetical protein OIU79_020131 [Salix purpurea]|uniref:Uncharacterized protein n=2 Tax=Salix TaxID=40685 RepID=A0A9Q0U5N6_9ROSI|nr:hypothetical protein OIU79_020131 [Salix purpurea]KAJ6723813.1 hypothetical protein OIU74_008219 [Salix koriyanagi]